jgi:ATP-dependent helicase HrpA
VDSLIDELGGPPWDQQGFDSLREGVRRGLSDRTASVVAAVERVLRAAQDVERGLSGQSSLALLPSLADVREHLARLVPDGFVSSTGWPYLRDLERYVRALALRLDRLSDRPANDATAMATLRRVEGEWQERARTSPDADGVQRVRRMIEELRVSLWAQTLGTAYPVSEKRVLRALDELSD